MLPSCAVVFLISRCRDALSTLTITESLAIVPLMLHLMNPVSFYWTDAI